MIETSDFFSKTVQHLARSLAHIEDTPWEKVSNFFNLCPVKGARDEYKLDHRGQSAVIAFGIYYLESRLNFPNSPFPHKNKIPPYFLDLMRNLPLARWTDSQLLFHNRCLPTSECLLSP